MAALYTRADGRPRRPLNDAARARSVDDRDAYLEAVFSLAALGVLLQLALVTFGAIALFGGCS